MQWYAISKLQFYFLKFEPHVRAMARAPTLVLAHAQSNVAEPAETFSLME
jgi:hypothetical protein